MKVDHDPIRHLNYISQALAQSKKPIGFFIGAGCPLSMWIDGKPLIPDVAGLTKIINEEFERRDDDLKEKYTRLIEHFEPQFNIEDVLTYVRSLISVVGNSEIRTLTKEDLSRIEYEICRLIIRYVDKSLPNTSSPYHGLASWIGSAERKKPVEVFTTNYDLLMEEALEYQQVPYFDGFVGSRRTFFDLSAIEEDYLPPRWVRFWKIHGSLNWVFEPGETEDEPGVVFRASKEPSAQGSHLIYPSHLKYSQSRRMPYLAMFDRLKAFLKTPSSVLFISGYSFSDEHINDTIFQGLVNNQSSIVIALLYGALENYPKAINMAKKRSNLSLFGFREGIIGSRRGIWQYDPHEDYENLPIKIVSEDSEYPGEDPVTVLELELGDFAALGHFTRSLIGEEKEDGK